MPVLRHKGTGLLVTFSDEQAGPLPGSEWERPEPEPVTPAPAPRRRARKTDTSD